MLLRKEYSFMLVLLDVMFFFLVMTPIIYAVAMLPFFVWRLIDWVPSWVSIVCVVVGTIMWLIALIRFWEPVQGMEQKRLAASVIVLLLISTLAGCLLGVVYEAYSLKRGIMKTASNQSGGTVATVSVTPGLFTRIFKFLGGMNGGLDTEPPHNHDRTEIRHIYTWTIKNFFSKVILGFLCVSVALWLSTVGKWNRLDRMDKVRMRWGGAIWAGFIMVSILVCQL